MKNIINKHRYDSLIYLFTLLTFLLACVKLVLTASHTRFPEIAEYTIIGIEAGFALSIFILGFKVSPVDFINSFRSYCRVLSKALSRINNEIEICTIQTPIEIVGDADVYYKEYLTATAKALTKLDGKNSHLVGSYRRIVVINSKDSKEKENEKKKLVTFVDTIFNYIKINSKTYNGNLKNIKILITNWDAINKTPFLNMDVLIVGEDFLNIAIPKYYHQGKEFVWGTSINIQKNALLKQDYKEEVLIFRQIYDEAWQAGLDNNRNNLIEVSTDPSIDIDTAHKNLIAKIDALFNKI